MNFVKVWEEKVVIPTYEVGEADKNPFFLEKRVYQGSSGKIYPYPAVETLSDEKVEKTYQAVYLENSYLKVMILPELGGRIHRAFDKTSQYDFVYYNHVIKPALVGLTGPWISGGIEFNWPQHHRPTTFLPVDYLMRDNGDGSKSVLVNDVDQMNGTKAIAIFTLYPDKAYIEIEGQLYNRTPLPQTFLWWANPALAVNENTQSIFPPDVHAVMDHGKRDVSRFPIATGVYYKYDYSEGVDISRYINIPVPTSYMAEASKYDFVGGYDYGREVGLLHVADHRISPGKKQWTWGCGDFGKAWDRNLTDSDGPYVELMTGVYTDNQPDFTWLKPFEEKKFKQYFMPYKKVGAVKNATIDAVINLETEGNTIKLYVYVTARREDVILYLYQGSKRIFEERTALSPCEGYSVEVPWQGADGTDKIKQEELRFEVWADNELLVGYQPEKPGAVRIPEPAREAEEPEKILTNEELYLTGLHIEQYRHATYLPDPYYEEGLKRDRKDIRINIAYGLLWLRRGEFGRAELYFRNALERQTWRNPNPYDSEGHYNLGLTLWYQDKTEEAYDLFYKAAWSATQQEMSYYYLAAIDTGRGNYYLALEMVEKGLVKNAHNIKARGLKGYLLRKLGRRQDASDWLKRNLEKDRFDYVSRYEQILWEEQACAAGSVLRTELLQLMRGFVENYLQTARDYAEFGAYEEAVAVLHEFVGAWPMKEYYEAYYRYRAGWVYKSCLEKAEAIDPSRCFPNKLEDIRVLEFADSNNERGAKAPYYMGNLCYDKLQFDKAINLWEKSVQRDGAFPTARRNLALAYYNKLHEPLKAKEQLEMAFKLNTADARIFLELDQLYKKLELGPEKRLDYYGACEATFLKRDDLYIEYVTLHNCLGRYEEAYKLLTQRKLHPWEGGEGKASTQYVLALTEMAKKAIEEKRFDAAWELLERALVYPENLGEGKLEGTKDNQISYYLGRICERTNRPEEAKLCYKRALAGEGEPAGMMYYNDQPADMILYQGLALKRLNRNAEANARFYKLIDFGERHMEDQPRTEYFAVSLPDFMIYEEDLEKRNRAHCNYLLGLGKLGLEQQEEAIKFFNNALQYDPVHINAIRYRNDARKPSL